MQRPKAWDPTTRSWRRWHRCKWQTGGSGGSGGRGWLAWPLAPHPSPRCTPHRMHPRCNIKKSENNNLPGLAGLPPAVPSPSPILKPFNIPAVESSLRLLLTLLPDALLVNCGRCLGLRFGACAAEARYDAGLKDRLAAIFSPRRLTFSHQACEFYSSSPLPVGNADNMAAKKEIKCSGGTSE